MKTLVVIAALGLAGCGPLFNSTRIDPASTRLTRITETQVDPATGAALTTRETVTGEAVGAGVRAVGDGASSAKAEGSLPSINLPGGMGSKGGRHGAAASLAGSSSWGLVFVGGLAVAAGLVALLMWGQRTIGLGLSGGGAVLITVGVLVEQYPWVWLLAAVAGAVGVVWWLLDARAAQKARTALRAVVQAVDHGDANTKRAVKKSVESLAGVTRSTTIVRSEIERAKQ